MSFQKNLKKLCKERNMTQKEFAKKVGLTERTVSYYAQTKRLPRLETLQKIAKELNVSIDELMS